MAKTKILLIDDEEDFLFLLKRTLESAGYEVVTASGGAEGVEKAESAKPDMVICDWSMPEKNGFDVLGELKAKKTFHAPFVMLTAMDDFDKLKKAYGKEADFYIKKTLSLDKLLQKIQTLLNISQNRIW